MNLSGEEQEEVEAALRRAFDTSDLERMLKLRLAFVVEDEIGVNISKKEIVHKLVNKASDGWIDKLLLAAFDYKKDSLVLKEILGKLNIRTPIKVNPENLVLNDNQKEERLEKVLNKRAPFLKYEDFMNNFNDIGKHICRIEIPVGNPKGTGWLVGPSLILTAYHVVKDVDNNINGLIGKDIQCRFDYASRFNNDNENSSKVFGLADNWLIDKSPYAIGDVSIGQPEPTNGELDYALIQLNEAAGNEVMLDGSIRGWVIIPENSPVMGKDDIMVVAQHPMGRSLEIAFGEVLGYNKNTTRIMYNTNTEGGSSGSPCFDIKLIPFGLHHASGPAENLHYNQCVPLRQIIKLMKSHNVAPFWITTN